MIAKTYRPLKLNDITATERADTKKAISAAALGNATEWFDFGVYGSVAFAPDKILFFDASPNVQTIITLGTPSVPFIFWPLGGLMFGTLGDKIDRQRVLVMMIIAMSLSTSSIGLILSYDSIRIWSPVILLLLKVAQDSSVGGEYADAPAFIAEYSPDHRRGFMASWLDFGPILEFLLGVGMISALHLLLDDNKLVEWGWRIPFLPALPLGIISLYLRHALDEIPVFREHIVNVPYGKRNKTSPRGLLRRHKRNFLIYSSTVLIANVTHCMLSTCLPSYFSHNLGYLENRGVLIITVVMIRMLFVQPLIDWLSGKYGHRPFILTDSSSLLFFSWPPFYLLTTGKSILIFFGLLVLTLSLNMLVDAMVVTLSALFPTSIRYSDLTVVFNISVALAGLTPTITLFLVGTTHNPHILAFYLMIFGLFGLVATKLMYRPVNEPLTGGKSLVSGKAETKELLAEHHDRIEESIEAIGERTKELQRKRGILAVQHPHIDQYLRFGAKSEAV